MASLLTAWKALMLLTPLLVYVLLSVKTGDKTNSKMKVSLKRKTQARISFVIRIIKVAYLIF